MQQTEVTAEVSGTIKKVYHAIGDEVLAGDVLYEIDADELEKQIASANDAVTKIQADITALSQPQAAAPASVNIGAEAEYQAMRVKYEQFLELQQQGIISMREMQKMEQQYNAARTAYEASRAAAGTPFGANIGSTQTLLAMKQEELTKAQKRAAQLEAQKKNLIIVSPIEGVLSDQIYQAGQKIEAGYLLAAVSEKEKCRVEAYVPAAEAAKLTEGQAVEIELSAYPNDLLDGVVETVVQAADAEGQMPVILRITELGRPLRPGMQADIYTN